MRLTVLQPTGSSPPWQAGGLVQGSDFRYFTLLILLFSLSCIFLSKSAGLSQGRLRIRIYRQFSFHRQQTNLMLFPICHVNMLMRRLPFSSREQSQLWSLPLSALTCNSRHRDYTNTASQHVWNVIGFQFTEYVFLKKYLCSGQWRVSEKEERNKYTVTYLSSYVRQ